MFRTGYIESIQEGMVRVAVPIDEIYTIEKQKITSCTVEFSDGRKISPDQRKKVYAILGDISDWNGDPPEYIKEQMKYSFLEYSGGKYFSLSDCTVTDAREFINYLIDFCFYQNIPTRDTMLNHTDDIGHYLYSCLVNRKCAVCNARAEIHHVEGSRIGMGFNRNKVNNLGRRAIAICRKHHAQAHNSEREFFEKYHIYGIKLDEYLVKKLGL